jgi:hypothetical protein
MAETKEAIAAERDRLRRENENLRGQLAAAGAGRANTTTAQFVLTEGNRQDLLARGETVIGGRRYTREQVEDAIEGNPDYDRVDLGDRDPDPATAGVARGPAVPGVDYIYPSVLPGRIDPKVAGTPGINGPAATEQEMRDAQQDLEPPSPPEFASTSDDDDES